MDMLCHIALHMGLRSGVQRHIFLPNILSQQNAPYEESLAVRQINYISSLNVAGQP